MTAYTDSDPVTTELELLGVWIHDPDSPDDSARHYPYGKAQRETAVDVMGEGLYYAGRTYPVTDYGEHQAQEFRVTVDIPFGQDWLSATGALRTLAESRRTLFFRDNRGRALAGQMRDYRESDREWGTQVSFTATAAHAETEEAT